MSFHRPLVGLAVAASLAACLPSPLRAAAGDAAEVLRSLHADFERYIRSVHVVGTSLAAGSTERIYSGLVRPGGHDPRVAEDAPASGPGVRNDVLVFAPALEGRRSAAWLRLVLDHEYFHARHLAHGWDVPVADFADPALNHDYYEATAWGYVLERAARGEYGTLHPSELREAGANYKRHYEPIRAYILERQPSAWTHYARFMPDMDGAEPAGAQGAAAGSGSRGRRP